MSEISPPLVAALIALGVVALVLLLALALIVTGPRR